MLKKLVFWGTVLCLVAVSLLADEVVKRDRDLVPAINDQAAVRYDVKEIKGNALLQAEKEEFGKETTKEKESERWYFDVPVMNTNNSERYPTMCYDLQNDERVFIAAEMWDLSTNVSKDIKIKRSVNHGDTWLNDTENQFVVEGSVSQPLFKPQIIHATSTEIGMAHVRQFSTNDWDIVFRKFNTVNLATNSLHWVDARVAKLVAPSVASDVLWYFNGPYIYITYIEASASPRTLLFRRSNDLGVTWTTQYTVANISTAVEEQYLHTSIDQFHNRTAIAYVDREGSFDVVKVTVSDNFGGTWSTPVTVSNTSRHCRFPQIRLVNNDNIIVVYEYFFSDSDIDVYYSYSLDGGSVFYAGMLSNTISNERFPNVSSYRDLDTVSDVYVTYTIYPNEVLVRKAINPDYSLWGPSIQVRDSTSNISPGNRNGIVVKPSPMGVIGSAVTWGHHFSATDIDIYYDAEWRGVEVKELQIVSFDPSIGVTITVSPSDMSGDDDGITPFDRYYEADTVVYLTAPEMAGGNQFGSWERNGVFYSSNRMIDLTMEDDYTLTAAYEHPGDATITIGLGVDYFRYPVDMFYRNSLYETLFFAAEMGSFTGLINGITFYNNFVTDLPDMPTRIWLGMTDLGSLAGGWIPSTEMQLVFDETVDYPSGFNDIYIPLQNPFIYEGDNLVMLVHRPMDTTYYSSLDRFIVDGGVSNRARSYSSDSQVLDPADPPAGDYLTGFYPRTTFHVTATAVDDPFVLPQVTRLGSVYPNPFNPETRINFSLAEEQDVVLEIYNIRGQKVKILIRDKMQPGEHVVVWKGVDDAGKEVGTGIYVVTLKAGSREFSKKISLIK